MSASDCTPLGIWRGYLSIERRRRIVDQLAPGGVGADDGKAGGAP